MPESQQLARGAVSPRGEGVVAHQRLAVVAMCAGDRGGAVGMSSMEEARIWVVAGGPTPSGLPSARCQKVAGLPLFKAKKA